MDEVDIPTAAPLPEDVAARLDARQRMIVTTAKLLQRQGYHATGLKQVVADARAPRGSIYHHFPGGKGELAVLAVRVAAHELTRAITAARRDDDTPEAVLRRLARSLSRWLEASAFREGCPVSTVTLEVAPEPGALTEACAEAYAEWVGLIAATLQEAGHDAEDANGLATTVVAGIEGALLLCRAQRSTTPLEVTTEHLARLLAVAG